MRRRIDKSNTTSKAEKAFKMLSISLALLSVLIFSAYGAVLWFIEPPQPGVGQMTRPPQHTVHLTGSGGGSSETGESQNTEHITIPRPDVEEGVWRNGVFSVLILGEDDGFGGPDVIMLALFDTNVPSLDVLSIPRDTVVNVPWGLKKINSVQAFFRQLPGDHPHYVDAMAEQVGKLVGHIPQNWITLDLRGFINLVDAIGGVEFYVPQNMVYNDPYQDLVINLQRGLQRLNGNQAMQLVRFRSFPTGDIARIGVQQDFLAALSEQLLSMQALLAMNDLIRIFVDNVETDMTFRNLAFFAYELLRLDAENIRFHAVDASIANISDSVNGVSYVTLYVEPWLRLINSYMNPFTWQILAEDLEILTRNLQDGQFFTTNGAEFTNNWVR